ncbi:hypothetical protein [Vibrio sp. EA2]|uniref:hypothetical protein n=1 Tax=Vibrio sp. EA2 TaxID=3079860 RepID=UPI0029491EBC|nr:hypothetical protein [Vibrio sp. EA2]MDV6252832.1 hypothetical protein [Vibrio sp. EA2]
MMQQLILIKALLEDFLQTLSSTSNEHGPRKVSYDIKKVLEKMSDPFILWGDLKDSELLEDLYSIRQRLQLLYAEPDTEIHRQRKKIINAINTLNKDNEITIQYLPSDAETSGLINQLSVRQKELNEAIAESLQKVDERTGAAERQVERVQRQAINAIRQETSELKEVHSDELKNEVLHGVSEIESTVEKASSRLSLSLREATDSLIKKHQDDYDSLYNELRNKTLDQIKQTDEGRADFDRKIDALNSAFEQQASALNSRFDQEQESFKRAFQESVKQEVTNYKTVRQLLKEQLDEAKEVVGTLSKKALAHEHLKQAEREAFAYWGFQGAGLLFLFTAILMSVAIFGDSLGLKLPWLTWLVEFSETNGAIQIQGSATVGSVSEATWFFKRISIVVLLTAPGLYLLKEAANHRAKENLYRQRGVQLASITPYLKELEETERNAIKKELVQSFFSFHDGKADTQNVPDFLRDLKETTKIIRSIDRATQPTNNKRAFTQRRKRATQSVEG